MWRQRGSVPRCLSCAHATFTARARSATTPWSPATRLVSAPTPPPPSIPPCTLPKPRCPPTQYDALPAPQYQSSPLAPYPTSFTAHGDTYLASPIRMPLAMSLLNHCHLVLDCGRRSLFHSAPTRTWHVRLCSIHVPTLRTNSPTTPTTLQCPSPRHAQHLIMSSTPLQPHSSTAYLLSRAP